MNRIRLLATAFLVTGALSAPALAQSAADQQLKALYDGYAEWDARDSGTIENARGESRPADYLPRVDLASQRQRAAMTQQFLSRLNAIDARQLSSDEQVNAAVLRTVLEADIDPEMQVALLSDLEAARRLRELESEADEKAEEADTEAERQLEEIEREARRRVEEVELEARRRIEQVLAEAEEKSRKVNEEASRKVKRVAEEVERKADKATRDAVKDAKARAERRSRGRRKKKGE